MFVYPSCGHTHRPNWARSHPIFLFASHLTEHFNFAEIIWKLVRSFLGIIVSGSWKNVTYRSSSRSVAGTFMYRPSSSSVSKVTHILLYRRSIVKLLKQHLYTFMFVNMKFVAFSNINLALSLNADLYPKYYHAPRNRVVV